MLSGTWWITPEGSWSMGASEHSTFAMHVMLGLPPTQRVPNYWFYKGVPKEELDNAIARGADKKAIEFLENKNNDPRLFVLRQLGWCRTARNKFNVWLFDQRTADMIRNADDYWHAQDKFENGEVIDIEEFAPTGQTFTIRVKALLGGGTPEAMRAIAGVTEAQMVAASIPPTQVTYSTIKYGELARSALYHRTGDNPRRRSRR